MVDPVFEHVSNDMLDKMEELNSRLTNFVNNKRIEHAIYLLNTTKLPIQDIAVQCGITDVNYFTKLFKKIKNMTPSQYREMIQ